MIPQYRKQFNEKFNAKKHAKFIHEIQEKSGMELQFKVSESPIFLTDEFREKLIDVSNSIIDQIKWMSNEELNQAIPKEYFVPNDTEKPHFLILDFGICEDENSEVIPQLIELQAFPSLYGFMKLQQESLIKTYPFLNELKQPIPKDIYISKLKEVILDDENPENVVLLEIFPEKQKTYIDFKVTQEYLGIKILCVTQVKKQGNKLYYEKNGALIPIHRIYNRVIFDELYQIEDLKLDFDFKDQLDVEWVTHPNWFYKVSKYLLPKLDHQYVPKSYFLNEFPASENLEEFVLKPLFSFAGAGVNLNPNQLAIDAIQDKENYILQRKVKYEALFEDPNGDFSKAEFRMMFLWHPNEENPEWITNMVRMTKTEWANMGYVNSDEIWIGCSYGFFENKTK